MKSQLRWTSHVVHIKDHRLPNKLLYSELSQGKHSQGGQKKNFKDTLKVSIKSFGINPNCLEYLAQDWDKWSEVVRKKSVKPEETQQLSCAGNLEKALPLLPPFLVLTAQDSSAHRLVSLAICALTDAFFNQKVDQMVLINYDGQRRTLWKTRCFVSVRCNTNFYLWINSKCISYRIDIINWNMHNILLI